MEGRKVMDWQAIWYVLAGFVLGFATSTLWEWLYYRRHRQQTGMVDAGHFTLLSSGRKAAPPPPAAEYRSPGVFLESEQQAGPDASIAAPQPERWEAAAPVVRSRRSEERPADFAPARPQTERYFEVSRLRVEDLEEEETGEGEPESAQDHPPRSYSAPRVVRVYDAPRRPSSPPDEPVAAEAEAAADVTAEAEAAADVTAEAAGREPAAAIAEESEAARPAAVDAQQVGRPDNFVRIKGIGGTYRQRLYQAGIATWRQLVETDSQVLRKVTNARSNARIEEWQAQAQALMEKYGREEATYHGPPPDDLTAIPGIGPTTLDALYAGGIVTFDQLAAATPTQLRALLPTPVSGAEVDYTPWIEQARQLAEKRKQASE